MTNSQNATRPGLHPSINLSDYSDLLANIMRRLSRHWYVTNGGNKIDIGPNAKYHYFLAKPTQEYTKLFGIDREVIFLFSDYEQFEPRVIEAIEQAYDKHPQLRLEPYCSVLISSDIQVADKIKSLLREDKEIRVVVPFHSSEILRIESVDILSKFKNYLYSKNLFSYDDPLRTDLFFFGRKELVMEIANAHRSGSNSGLFGLRRSGKTSTVFNVQRALEFDGFATIYIDCQDTSFHQRRWNEALWYVAQKLSDRYGQTCLHGEDRFTEKDASLRFEEAISQVMRSIRRRRLVIFFDEIERITFDIGDSTGWKDGTDFIPFWQTLRSLYNRNQNIYTFSIVGTNPKCIETSMLDRRDNPIYRFISPRYLLGFNAKQTSEMLIGLGSPMGVSFQDNLYSKLSDDFGGHPFLMRQACSLLIEGREDRPLVIDKVIYEKTKNNFALKFSEYFVLILDVLKTHYPLEFDMLTYLARGDEKTFASLSREYPEIVEHLIGYGILIKNNFDFTFKMDLIGDYLRNLYRYSRLELTSKEMLAEIGERRARIESEVRKIVKITLKSNLGAQGALDAILESKRAGKKDLGKTLEQVLDPKESEVYLNDLKNIIIKNWTFFKHIFEIDKEVFRQHMDVLNKFRKIEAHSGTIGLDEISQFRASAVELESFIDGFFR